MAAPRKPRTTTSKAQSPIAEQTATAFADAAETVSESVSETVTQSLAQARKFADAVAEATATSIRRNQEFAQKAWDSFAAALPEGIELPSLASLSDYSIPSLADWPKVDLRQAVAAGFDMAQSVLDAQRHAAERLVSAVTPS
ncbi:MAG: hypothetical protein ACRDWW_04095 [Acidimicrobiales bacterium]